MEIGDLVWAKTETFPYCWPGKIVHPPQAKSPTSEKSGHYIYFFESENYDWISEEHILPHSEDMISSWKESCPSRIFQNAIDAIVKAALEEKPESEQNTNGDLYVESTHSEPEKETQEDENATVETPKRKLSSELDDEVSDSLGLFPVPKVQKLDVSSALSFSPTATNSLCNAVIPSSNEESDSFSLSCVPKVQKLDNVSSALSFSPTASDDASISGSSSSDSNSNLLIDIDNICAVSNECAAIPITKKIGFLGLGKMGQAIVKNLLKSGHQVFIWNRTSSVCDPFIKDGAIKCVFPKDVVAAADIILCCVSDSEAVKSIVFGVFGVLHGFKASIEEKGYVEMSSIDPTTSRKVGKAINKEGGKYLEAPLVGNRRLAKDRNLTILGAGDQTLFNECEACFHAISKNAFFITCDVGHSSQFNLVLSMLTGTIYGALGEAFALAKSIDVSHKKILDVLRDIGFSSAIQNKGQAMLNQNFAVETPLKHQQKDINLALMLSDNVGQPMPVAASANELYKQSKGHGFSEHDVSAIYKGARRLYS